MIDLKKEFGKRYRVTVEDSYEVETFTGKSDELPWYYEIVGRTGRMFPVGEHQVGIQLNTKVANRFMRTFPEIHPRVVCDECAVFHVTLEQTKHLISWVKPRLRRVFTPEQAQKAAERLKSYRFRPAVQRTTEPINATNPGKRPQVAATHEKGL